jgi:hypothetical protein
VENYCSQLLNVHRVSDVRQREIHAAELLVPEPSTFVVEIATAKLKGYKTPDIDQISAELIQAGGKQLCSKIHKLINAIWNKEEFLSSGRNVLFYLFTRSVVKMTVAIIKAYHHYQLHTKFCPISFFQG